MSLKSLPSAEVLNLVRSKGMLAKQLYLVSTVPTSDLDAIMPLLDEHLTYQLKLESDGVLFAAGPNWTEDEQQWAGAGTVVLRAENIAQAREIMEADPMHARGARSFTIQPWLVDEGKLKVELCFSTGTFKLQ